MFDFINYIIHNNYMRIYKNANMKYLMTLAYQSDQSNFDEEKSIDKTDFIKVIVDDKPSLKDNIQKVIKEISDNTGTVDIVGVSPLFEHEYLDMVI